MTTNTPAILVVIPTYNEREALPLTLARLRVAVPEAHALIVDDASPDGTGQWAEEQAQMDTHVHVIHGAGKAGLGVAYLSGFAWALEREWDIVCEMDADASHRPEQLQPLLDAVTRGADLAIGSRWVRGGAVHNWPKRRELLSRGANLYTALALGMGVRDATAGFRAFRVSALRTLVGAGDIASAGYCFQIDMTRRAVRSGLRVVEVPIDFDERQQGVSKMSGAIVKEAMLRVTQWGLAHRGHQLLSLIRSRRAQ